MLFSKFPVVRTIFSSISGQADRTGLLIECPQSTVVQDVHSGTTDKQTLT